MSKWFGTIGFETTEETAPSVNEPQLVERDYYGDLTKNNRRFDNGSTANGEITVSNQLSILADPFAQEHFYSIRYATLYGGKWKVTDVSVEYPRLVLTLGGLYRG
nr:MAG TPA_asm: hypothetical protein [Caudoviricetes sp.]